MTHSYMRHDPFIYETRLIHICEFLLEQGLFKIQFRLHAKGKIMNDSYLRHDSFIYATLPIHICDTTHSYMRVPVGAGSFRDQVSPAGKRENHESMIFET